MLLQNAIQKLGVKVKDLQAKKQQQLTIDNEDQYL